MLGKKKSLKGMSKDELRKTVFNKIKSTSLGKAFEMAKMIQIGRSLERKPLKESLRTARIWRDREDRG
ncbi:MAG: hypothetical protein DSO07_10125 [Thermoproteota archaeon]|jgi:hypothetical protein|uniref:Uncharacterized protein n=1 Tax=Candidatus Methanodesulfokora washburnensis TaxID=2478471 RepID=A0A3R9PMZ7_9CREN|nr:hypothetical protein [Candidatus Methanodesulfokores washburnensis]RSN78340.1 hypothetical protein D6D85_01255 [Candidatus Methanodesulfokores washburnensis]TDA39688.1 MAG: hypothetical protein DSO07_10125 [Candidatus Korarchaeota archaeon]